MCQYVADVNGLCVVVDRGDQPALVAADIEDCELLALQVGVREKAPDVLNARKLRPLHDSEPVVQRSFAVRMKLDESLESLA
jgi:hypothetical protein